MSSTRTEKGIKLIRRGKRAATHVAQQAGVASKSKVTCLGCLKSKGTCTCSLCPICEEKILGTKVPHCHKCGIPACGKFPCLFHFYSVGTSPKRICAHCLFPNQFQYKPFNCRGSLPSSPGQDTRIMDTSNISTYVDTTFFSQHIQHYLLRRGHYHETSQVVAYLANGHKYLKGIHAVNERPPEVSKYRLIEIVWFILFLAFQKQPFLRGAVQFEDPEYKLFNYMRNLKGAYSRRWKSGKSGFGSSHLVDYIENYLKFVDGSVPESEFDQYGIDISTKDERGSLPALPTGQGHVLFGKVPPKYIGAQFLFVKLEGYGTKQMSDVVNHNVQYASGILGIKEEDPDDSRESVPKEMMRDFIAVVDSLNETQLHLLLPAGSRELAKKRGICYGFSYHFEVVKAVLEEKPKHREARKYWTTYCNTLDEPAIRFGEEVIVRSQLYLTESFQPQQYFQNQQHVQVQEVDFVATITENANGGQVIQTQTSGQFTNILMPLPDDQSPVPVYHSQTTAVLQTQDSGHFANLPAPDSYLGTAAPPPPVIQTQISGHFTNIIPVPDYPGAAGSAVPQPEGGYQNLPNPNTYSTSLPPDVIAYQNDGRNSPLPAIPDAIPSLAFPQDPYTQPPTSQYSQQNSPYVSLPPSPEFTPYQTTQTNNFLHPHPSYNGEVPQQRRYSQPVLPTCHPDYGHQPAMYQQQTSFEQQVHSAPAAVNYQTYSVQPQQTPPQYHQDSPIYQQGFDYQQTQIQVNTYQAYPPNTAQVPPTAVMYQQAYSQGAVQGAYLSPQPTTYNTTHRTY